MIWTTKQDPSGWTIRWSEERAERYLAAGHWRHETLVDTAREAVGRDPDQTLIMEGDDRLTRLEAWEQALRLAGFFASRGLVPGDVVAFQLPNWLESAVVALAARMCGLIICPIPPIYREAELGFILGNCGAKIVFVPQLFRKHDHAAMLTRLRGELPGLLDVVVVRGDGDICWGDVLGHNPIDESALPAVVPSAIMMVMYTSGTTGRPKGVLHTHYSFGHRARAMVEAWNVGESDVIFMPSPVTHIAGAFWCFDIPWISGASSLLMDVWAPDQGVALIEGHGCTISGGATPFLQQLLEAADGRGSRLASLRLFFCGGTTVSPDLIREASAMFPDALFFRAYGSTEMTTATLGVRDKAAAAMGAETDGEIVPPVEILIVDDDGNKLPDGSEGAILAQGPGLFAGYLDPHDNEGCFREDGFFDMGDLGRIVHGQYIVITGRKKDIIIRSGENISPKEVEDALYRHPAVSEVAIVAMPSDLTGEKGCAFIIPRGDETIDLSEVKRFLDEVGLARQKFPEHIELVKDLPRVPSGKVKKDVLRARAREIAKGIQA